MEMYNPAHPGELLKEAYLEPLNLTLTLVAEKLGIPRTAISELINGHRGISPVMALRLSKAFPNTSPDYWLALQAQYDLWQAKQKINLERVQIIYPTPVIAQES